MIFTDMWFKIYSLITLNTIQRYAYKKSNEYYHSDM